VRVQEQVDSLLLPVVKSYEQRQTQLRMDAFVTMTHRFSKIRSKRLQAAVSAVAGAPLSDELTLANSEPRKTAGAAAKGKKRGRATADAAAPQEGADASGGQAAAAKARRSKRVPAASATQLAEQDASDEEDADAEDEYVPDDAGEANEDDDDGYEFGVPVDNGLSSFLY
jgi:DNA excision repair protein ERCC-5